MEIAKKLEKLPVTAEGFEEEVWFALTQLHLTKNS